MSFEGVFSISYYSTIDPDQGTVCPFLGQSIPDEINLVPVFACIDPASAIIPEKIELTVQSFSHYEFVYWSAYRIMARNFHLINRSVYRSPPRARETLPWGMNSFSLSLGFEIANIETYDLAFGITVIPYEIVVNLKDPHRSIIHSLITNSSPVAHLLGKFSQTLSWQRDVGLGEIVIEACGN